MKNNADGLIVSKTSLLPICAEISQIRLDATIEIAFAVFLKLSNSYAMLQNGGFL